jgi:hypothetical protein
MSGNIIKGKNDDVSVPAGIFQSFADAPGGFSEELKEISFSPGVEYLYNDLFCRKGRLFLREPRQRRQALCNRGFWVKV